jgi:O-antigen ligase
MTSTVSMRSITGRLLWLFVFTVPWDVVAVQGVGALSRLVGVAVLGTALLTTAIEGKFRKPTAIFAIASAYIGFTALSLLWTIAYPDTVQIVWTGVQILGSVWVVAEFTRTREQQQSLLVAFCLGELIPLAGIFNSLGTGTRLRFSERYTAIGLNADDIALTLAIGIPVAWHLIMTYSGPLRRTVRATGLIYFVLAPVAILLTGTRGAAITGVVALSIVPLTLPWRSIRSVVLIAVMLVAIVASATVVVPQRMWARILSIQQELLEGGSMAGRAAIWQTGVDLIPEHPFFGVGASAFGAAVEPILLKRQAPHNLVLGLLVELGIVGLSIYAALLGACAMAIPRMPLPERKLWAVLMLCWLVGVMSLNWEYRKVTWLLFGLVAAQSAADSARRRLSASPAPVGEAAIDLRSLQPVYLRSADQRAIR